MWPAWARSAGRGAKNYFRGYPVIASIEVTYGCSAACRHCNIADVVDIAHVAHGWGVGLSYSAYTTTKNGDASLMLSADDTRVLAGLIDEIIALEARGLNILNPPSLLKRTVRSFADTSFPPLSAWRPARHR